MRKGVVAGTLVAVIAGVVPSASAGSIVREEYETGWARCIMLSAGGPIITISVGAGQASVHLVGIAEGETDQVSITIAGASAIVPMYGYGGEPAGEAVVTLGFAPVGEPMTDREWPWRDGNVLFGFTSTWQPLAVRGTLGFQGATYDVSGCEAAWEWTELRTTSPAAYAYAAPWGLELSCSLGSPDPSAIFLYAAARRGRAFAQLGIGSDRLAVDEDAVLNGTSFHADLEFVSEDGERSGVFATADATLRPAGPPEIAQEGGERWVTQGFEVTGVLSVPELGDLDLSSCRAERTHYSYIETGQGG